MASLGEDPRRPGDADSNLSGEFPSSEGSMLRRHDPRGVAPLVCSIGASPDDETPGRVRVYGAGKATREARRRSSSSEGSMLPRESNLSGESHRAKARCYRKTGTALVCVWVSFFRKNT